MNHTYQLPLSCDRACVKRGQFDAGCMCDNALASHRFQYLMSTNPTVELLGRNLYSEQWYVIAHLKYKQGLLMIQEDPMNRKIGDVIWPSTPVS